MHLARIRDAEQQRPAVSVEEDTDGFVYVAVELTPTGLELRSQPFAAADQIENLVFGESILSSYPYLVQQLISRDTIHVLPRDVMAHNLHHR